MQVSTAHDHPAAPETAPVLNIRPWRVTRLLAGIVAVLTLLNLAALAVRIYTHHDGSPALTFIIYFFNTEAEWNLPAFYSAGALLLAGLLLLAVAWLTSASGRTGTRYWLGLGAIFIYMAFDELCRLHEQLNEMVPSALASMGVTLPGWLKWAWVIPGAVFVLGVTGTYARFVWRLPTRTRNLFFLAAAVYVTGALGMEVVAILMKRVREHSVEVLLVSAMEEFLEMAGVVIFIHAILDHAARSWPRITVALTEPESPDSPVAVLTPAEMTFPEHGPRAA